MVRVTKFANTNLSDSLLNETSLFWDSSDPSSGLPVDVFFLNTSEKDLKQNTGTEGSPTWTSRLKGSEESVEKTTESTNTTGVGLALNRWHFCHDFTFGSAGDGKLYYVTDLEIVMNSSGGTSNAVMAIFSNDADPPTLTNPSIYAYSEVFSTTASATEKHAISYLRLLRGGTRVFMAANFDANDVPRGSSPSSQNFRFDDTYSDNPGINRTGITWTAATSKLFGKIYYREII